MTPRRSRSQSTPSEGEIIESESEAKATTSQTPLNGTKIDRHTRASPSSAPRSPASWGSGSPFRTRRSRSRTRSRSPYRDHRGSKRRRGGGYDDRLLRRNGPSLRHAGYKYSSGGYDDRRGYCGRSGFYYDYDREDSYGSTLHYSDDYSRRGEGRSRPRSRSPAREVRKRRKYSDDELDSREQAAKRWRSPGGQSVSGRVNPTADTQSCKGDAETRENQVRQGSSDASFRDVDRYISLVLFYAELLTFCGAENTILQDQGESSGPVDEAARLEARRKRREAIRAKYKTQAASLRLQALQTETETGSSTPSADTVTVNDTAPGSPQWSRSQTPNGYGKDSFPDLKMGEDFDLVNANVPVDGADKDEPSAADYDPVLDMKEDGKKQNSQDGALVVAHGERRADQKSIPITDANEQSQPQVTKDPYDMFAEDNDDMFAEDTEATAGSTQAAIAPAPQQPQELDISMMDNWDDPEGYYNVRLGELIDGRYHVHQSLGKGMFSSVVRATDSRTDSMVAIKIIRQNDTMRKAGMKEIEILQQLLDADPEDKKHIIRFERWFDHKGHLCMVFENLSMNLREVLKKFGRDVGLNLRAIRTYAQQIFLGLSLLRKCNILHADLKPDNLLVNEQRNTLKVCDLGSASPATENEITPYLVSRFYRAPEIMLGIPYDHGIDVWSVGCTLFELYTGKILFTGRNNNQMLRSIMECRGKYPPKLLRRGALAGIHFDEMLNFHSREDDKITGRVSVRVMDIKKPTRDLKSRLMGQGRRGATEGETKELQQFMDLLDRCLNLNPEKRCTPWEALRHPFLMRGQGSRVT